MIARLAYYTFAVILGLGLGFVFAGATMSTRYTLDGVDVTEKMTDPWFLLANATTVGTVTGIDFAGLKPLFGGRHDTFDPELSFTGGPAMPHVINNLAIGIVATLTVAMFVVIRRAYRRARPAPSVAAPLPKPRANWWRRRSLAFRKWAFWSVVWAAGMLVLSFGPDPFELGLTWRWNNDDLIRLLSAMFVPPLFVGAAAGAYRRWVM